MTEGAARSFGHLGGAANSLPWPSSVVIRPMHVRMVLERLEVRDHVGWLSELRG